jgi:hypothetical protein
LSEVDRELTPQQRWAAQNQDKIKAAKKRYLATEHGKQAAREYAKRRRAMDPKRDREYRRKWRAANPDKVKAQILRSKLVKGGLGDPARHRRNALARTYRITEARYAELLLAQGGRCAICQTDKGNDKGHALFIDHCHTTGTVRGLLCNRCNSALGYMADSPERLRLAADYLERARD